MSVDVVAVGYVMLFLAPAAFLLAPVARIGAWLVLRGQLSPGAMIAASILMGRALQPVEVLVAQWPRVQRAQDGWRDLAALLSRCPPVPARTALPRPVARLEIDRLDSRPSPDA